MSPKWVTLKNGTTAVPFFFKCKIVGCRRGMRGYRSASYGGGAFHNKAGTILTDLRDHNFLCPSHR